MTLSASANSTHTITRPDRPIRLGGRSMSRRRLARLVGVTPSHIGMIWSGRRRPSIDLAIRIAKTFNVTVNDVLEAVSE